MWSRALYQCATCIPTACSMDAGIAVKPTTATTLTARRPLLNDPTLPSSSRRIRPSSPNTV